MKCYSQLGEDIFVFQNFINVPRTDVVLFEIGAFDGVTYSNTLALEEFCKCKCVLVEPSPVNVRKISINRPNADIHKVAVAGEFGICEFVGHTAIAGITNELSERYIDQWGLKNVDKYKVISAPMRAITDVEDVSYVDFLSIDVQGAEFYALSSMNWNVPVGVICIELEGQRPQYDEACRGILKGMGFQFKRRLHISEFWFRPDYFRSELLFDPEQKFPIRSFDCQHFNDLWQTNLKDCFY